MWGGGKGSRNPTEPPPGHQGSPRVLSLPSVGVTARRGVTGEALGAPLAGSVLVQDALTCLVLLAVPRVPVPHQVTGVIGVQVQFGQHLLPAQGTGGGGGAAPYSWDPPRYEKGGGWGMVGSTWVSPSERRAEFLNFFTPQCS